MPTKPNLNTWTPISIPMPKTDLIEIHFVAEDGHHRQTLRTLPDGTTEIVEDIITPLDQLSF